MPRSLSRRVLVEHQTSGARKWVLRSKLPGLGPRWKRVAPPRKKRPPEVVAEPSAESASVKAESSSPDTPAESPETKEE